MRVEHFIDDASRRERYLAHWSTSSVDADNDVCRATCRESGAFVQDTRRDGALGENMHPPGVHTSGLVQRAVLRFLGRPQLADVAVLEHRDLGHAQIARERRVSRQMVQRAVHRDESPRTHQLDHATLLVAVSVSAHVHLAVGPPCSQLYPAPKECTDEAHDVGLVSWDHTARHHDDVSRSDVERWMFAAREAGEGAGVFPLRPGRDGQHTGPWELACPIGGPHQIARPLEIRGARVRAGRARRGACHASVHRHAAPQGDDLPAVAASCLA
jgi:hypothetical protein